MRLTTHRKKILDLLKDNQKPLSAEQIMVNFCEYKIDLSTIYRALEALHTNGYVGKSVIENTAYYYLNDNHHHHFIICLNCKKMEPIGCVLNKQIANVAANSSFKVVSHDLTLYGYCPDCRQ